MPQPAEATEPVEALLAVWSRAGRWLEAEQERLLLDPDLFGGNWRRLGRIENELLPAVAAEMDRLARRSREWIGSELPGIWRAGAVGVADAFTWTLPHRGAIERLAVDTYNDVLAATTHVTADTRRWIRETSRGWQQLASTGALDNTAARRRWQDTAQRRGISAVTYRNGARHGVADYGDMLFRTKSAMAYNGGTLARSRELGFTMMEILDGGSCGLYGHDSLPLAAGLVVPIEVAEQYPLAHPRCRRAFVPRVDHTRTSSADAPAGSFLYDPTTNRDVLQRRENRDTARENRRRARQGRQPRQARQFPRRPSDRPTYQQSDLANPGAVNRARARHAARLDADARTAEEAAARLEAARIARRPPDIDDITARHGITTTQWDTARDALDGIRDTIKATADTEARRLFAVIDDIDAQVVRRPDRKVRRTQGGYDWLEQVDDATYDRIRRTRFKKNRPGDNVSTPDLLATNYRYRFPAAEALKDDEIMLEIVDLWDREAAAREIARGRMTPRTELHRAVPQLLDDPNLAGIDTDTLAALFDPAGDTSDAVARVAAAWQERAQAYARSTLPKPTTGRPAPWQLTLDDYLAEYDQVWQAAQQVRPLRIDPDWGPEYTPGDLATVTRMRELAPDTVLADLGDTPTIDQLWARLTELARHAGYLDETT